MDEHPPMSWWTVATVVVSFVIGFAFAVVVMA